MNYLVKWENEIEADSKLDAAKKALQMIIDQESTAHGFEVAVDRTIVITHELGIRDLDEYFELIDLDDNQTNEPEPESFTFISSHGELKIDNNGNVLNKDELSNWLLNIKKVDVEEMIRYNKSFDIAEGLTDGDCMDFGYWDNDDKYHAPDKMWRQDIYHNVTYHADMIELLIDDSIKWIKENRPQ